MHRHLSLVHFIQSMYSIINPLHSIYVQHCRESIDPTHWDVNKCGNIYQIYAREERRRGGLQGVSPLVWDV